MARKLKFSEIIQGSENPHGVTTQTVNGTEHWPFGGWNNQAYGSTPPDWSPDRWAREAGDGSPFVESGPGVMAEEPLHNSSRGGDMKRRRK